MTSVGMILLALVMMGIHSLSNASKQDRLDLIRRSSEEVDSTLDLYLGHEAISRLDEVLGQDGLLLLSTAAESSELADSVSKAIGDDGEEELMTAAERKRRYNRERQRMRRANFTSEEKRKELKLARECHRQRLEMMTVEERIAYQQKKRADNKAHYYEVIKPQNEEKKKRDACRKGRTMNEIVEENFDQEQRAQVERRKGERDTLLVKRGKSEKSVDCQGKKDNHDASQYDSSVDLELRLGSSLASRPKLQKVKDSTKRREGKEEIVMRYVEHQEREKDVKVQSSSRALRATSWRAIPNAEMSPKQKWYANLTEEQREEYRRKCREKARFRRDAAVAEDVARKREGFRLTRLNRSEEDKKAYGATYGPSRREYCRRYYKEKVKPRRDAMLAACSRYPSKDVSASSIAINEEALNDDSVGEVALTSDYQNSPETTNIEPSTSNKVWHKRSDCSDPSPDHMITIREEEDTAMSFRGMSLNANARVSNSFEAVDRAIEHRAKRRTTWRDVPTENLSMDQIGYEVMEPAAKKKFLQRVKMRQYRTQQVMTPDQKNQARLRKNYLTRERYKKLSVEDRRAYLAHRRLVYHCNQLRREKGESREDAAMEVDKVSDCSEREKGSESQRDESKVKRSEPVDVNDTSLDLSLGLTYSDATATSISDAPLPSDETRIDLIRATRRTNYRKRLDRMTQEEREAYLIQRREAARNRRLEMSKEKREEEKARDRIRRCDKKQEKKMLREEEFVRLKIGFDGFDEMKESVDHLNDEGEQSTRDGKVEEERAEIVGPKGGNCHKAIRKTKWRSDIPHLLKTYSQLEYEKMTPEQKQRHREKSREYQREKREKRTMEERRAFNEYLTHRRTLLPEEYRESIRKQENERKKRLAAARRALLEGSKEEESMMNELDESELQLDLKAKSNENKEHSETVEKMRRRHEENLEYKRLAYRRKRENMTEDEMQEYRKCRAAAQRALYNRRKNDEDFRSSRRECQSKCRQRKKFNMLQLLVDASEIAHDQSENETNDSLL